MYETFLRHRFFFQFGETMAKRKFTEQRRRMRAVERQNPLDARDYRDAFAEFLNGLGVEVEMHWSGDDLEKFEGFKLSYDPVWDRTWYIVNNPYLKYHNYLYNLYIYDYSHILNNFHHSYI